MLSLSNNFTGPCQTLSALVDHNNALQSSLDETCSIISELCQRRAAIAERLEASYCFRRHPEDLGNPDVDIKDSPDPSPIVRPPTMHSMRNKRVANEPKPRHPIPVLALARSTHTVH